MLETLVSSRIRRTLFEHLLTHPTDRFYLRGLAKELGVSVSPLRRELKRLERSGMLTVSQEANILFYAVKTESPLFQQLLRAGRNTEGVVRNADPVIPALQPVTHQRPEPIPMETVAMEPPTSVVRRALSPGMLVGLAGVGMALMLITAGLFYLGMTNQQLVTMAQRSLSAPRAATAAERSHAASGAMQGSRWRLVPGAFGGFGTGATQEAY